MKQILIGVLLLASAQPVFADCGTIPPVGQTALRQLATRYADEIRSASDDVRRVWARRAAEQLAFSVSPAYGSKKAGPTNPQTKDGVARHVDGVLCVWDVVNGATRELQFGHGEPIQGQVFIPVTPTNHLAGIVDPPPPPAADDTAARVTALEQHAQVQAAQIGELLAGQAEIVRALVELQTHPIDERAVRALIDETLAALTMRITVGRSWGHSHSATVEVDR